jgi:thiol-disulfide isomerase/thioredoxin/YHS domain-containing protein
MRAHRIAFAAFCTLALAGAVRADQMPWQPSLEAAQQAAAKSNRLVVIHFWAPWCKPCMRLEKEVFSRAETAKALEANFVFVKVNADEAPGTTRSYGVSSLPTDVIVTPQGRLVSQFQSPPTANQYVTQLNQAAAGHRELARRASQQQAAVMPAAGPAVQPGVAPGVPPVQGGNPNDRYAEYFSQQQMAAGAAAGAVPPQAQPAMPQSAAPQAAPPQTAMPQAPLAQQGYGPAAPPAAPGADAQQAIAPQAAMPPQTAMAQQAPLMPGQPPVGAQMPMATQAAPGGAGYPPQDAYNAPATYQPTTQAPPLPPGCPPAALDGNCPVTLMERRQWATGNRAWGAVHRGRTYLFVGPDEKEKFLANPDFYSPVLSGYDPVLALDNQMLVPGRREYGFFGPDNRVYLFADEASLKRFEANPRRYAAEAVQAQAGAPTVR